MTATADPFAEIRLAWDCITYSFQESKLLKKNHLIIGLFVCLIDYFLSTIFKEYTYLFYAPFISTNYPFTISIIYGICVNIIFILFIFILQYFTSYYYWSKRYCNDTFRDSILSNDNYKINKIDGILLTYPWIILPMLICNCVLNIIILLTYINDRNIN
eukprot:477288_1